MKKIEDKDLKKILLELLEYYASFCEKNNLQYFLGGGTMLGAVRHKGFIPWDDDVDVMMPRKDYDRFIDLMLNENNNNYKLLTYHNVDNYAFPYAKLQKEGTFLIEGLLYEKYQKIGVHIDVFPIDGLPNNSLDLIMQFKRTQRLLEINAIATTKIKWSPPYIQKIVRWILVHTIFMIIKPKNIISKLEKILKRYDYDKSNFVAAVIGAYGKKELMNKDMLSAYQEVFFENLKLRIPIGYDKYLTDHYGNYMELPPLEKRVGHKKREVYWLD